MVKSEFQVEKTLRQGRFGVTLLARRLADRHLVVLKEIQTDAIKYDSERRKRLEIEMNALLQLSTPELVDIFDFTRAVPLQKSWFFVLEYCQGGTLQQKIEEFRLNRRRFTEVKILNWFLNIISAVNYLHNQKLVHGSISCRNILFEDVNCSFPKLGDFGKARVRGICKLPDKFGDEDLLTALCYKAPETFNNRADFKSDIWSLGVLLFELASLELPYYASNRSDMAGKMSKPPEKSIPKYFSDPYRALIGRMLAFRASKRPSAGDVLTDDCLSNRVLEQMQETLQLGTECLFEDQDESFANDDFDLQETEEISATPQKKRRLSSLQKNKPLRMSSDNN